MLNLSQALNNRYLVLILGGLFVLSLSYIAPVENGASDPMLSLVVSQSILENGTIKLDEYYAEDPWLFDIYAHQTIRQNGHLYYSYPTGPSLLALPAAWLALQAGWDMRDMSQNLLTQRMVAALICALIFVVMGLTAFNYLPQWDALIITAVTMLGSGLISVLALGMWNMNFTVLFITLALLLIARYENNPAAGLNGYLLGLLLVAAYLCRPSAALFILTIFGYLLLKDWRLLAKTAGTAFVGFLLFILLSQMEYGDWLPFYYRSSTWFYDASILIPVYGLTFGPARGLFIFSPFFLLTFIGGFYYFSTMRRRPLFWLCLLWFSSLMMSVATTRQWWGGFSYGPRLLTDGLPALFIMTLILWQAVKPQASLSTKRIWSVTYLALGAAAILLNAGHGLFSMKSNMWNAYPYIDHYPEYLFDWHYPQFWMTAERFHARREWHYLRLYEQGRWPLRPYQPGETVRPSINDSEQAAFIGWFPLPDQRMGTEIQTAKMIFTLDEVNPNRQYTLELSASAFGAQPVTMIVNGQTTAEAIFHGPPQTEQFHFSGNLLRSHNPNIIEFVMPEARYPTIAQLRQLSRYAIYHRLGLYSVTITLR